VAVASPPKTVARPQQRVSTQPTGLVSNLRQRPPAESGLIVSSWILASLAGLAAWLLLYGLAFSGFQEQASQHSLYATFRSEVAQEIAPLGGNIKLGKPVAILRVPQAGINDVVLEGTTSGVLEHGPGLESWTPLPGQAGWSWILGRQTLFGGPFRHLGDLRPGDEFDVTTGEGTFYYVVKDVRLSGGPEPPPLATGKSRLTLESTAGSGWRTASPNELIYVDAALKGKLAGSPAGRPAAVLTSEVPMHGDTSVLMPLVLWLQLLLLTVLVVVWVRSRWGGPQTWLVAVPAILAVLWVISETAFQLLPNLL
jgi:sortase A